MINKTWKILLSGLLAICLVMLLSIDDREIARVILGEQKFVNTETQKAIADLKCAQCKSAIENLWSFKCHNWAYAKPALLEVLQAMEIGSS
jgi:hypothetical protein